MLKKCVFLFIVSALIGSSAFAMQMVSYIKDGTEYTLYPNLNVNLNMTAFGFELLTINGSRSWVRKSGTNQQSLIKNKENKIKKDAFVLSNIIFKAILYSVPKKTNKHTYSLKSFLQQVEKKEFSKLAVSCCEQAVSMVIGKIFDLKNKDDDYADTLYELFVSITFDGISTIKPESFGLGWFVKILGLKTSDRFFDMNDLKTEMFEREKLLGKICGTPTKNFN